MTTEEMLNSDDIETAQLAANIIYQEKGWDVITEILENCKRYRFLHRYKDVIYITPMSKYQSIFIKDPTRTTLIDLK